MHVAVCKSYQVANYFVKVRGLCKRVSNNQ